MKALLPINIVKWVSVWLNLCKDFKYKFLILNFIFVLSRMRLCSSEEATIMEFLLVIKSFVPDVMEQ